MNKSSVEQIRQRFDADVERFSNLETGQTASIDSPLCLELVSEAAATVTPNAHTLLDIGCGAGNYALKLLERLPGLNVTLIDLSRPMLDRANERVSAKTNGMVQTVQGDIRQIELGANQFDVILAAQVLHHLRADTEWESVFAKLYQALTPGGSLWIVDQTLHSTEPVQTMMQARYAEYLRGIGGEAYQEKVFAYIEQEDTPRPLLYQTDLLKRVGFSQIEVLHKHNRTAAFGAIK